MDTEFNNVLRVRIVGKAGPDFTKALCVLTDQNWSIKVSGPLPLPDFRVDPQRFEIVAERSLLLGHTGAIQDFLKQGLER